MNNCIATTEFWSGQLFELITSDALVYVTQLIQHEPKLIIQRPITRNNKLMKIENGMPILVYFHNDFQGLSSFESNIYLSKNNEIVIKKPLQNDIKKAQRRCFFRIHVAVDLHFVSSKQNPDNFDELFVKSHDISGGGVSFHCTRKVFEVGDLISGNFQLEVDGVKRNIEFNGRIINVVKQKNKYFRISLEFINMGELVRSDIIKFCIFKQIELRNKIRRL